MELIITGLVAGVGGLVQGVTGFGSGIIMMMILPYFFAVPSAAGISNAISIVLLVSMIWSYRKYIKWRELIMPIALYLAVCSGAIIFGSSVDGGVMKKALGVFLVMLSIYFLFIAKKAGEKRGLGIPVKLFFIVASGICEGMFGIGGPLLVIYYLNSTDDSKEYLGMLSSAFIIGCTYNTIFRVIRGIILPEHFAAIAAGGIGIFIGSMIAKKLVDKLNPELIKKFTYLMIGLAGVLFLI